MSDRNPWGLTQKQVKVMDLLVMLGDQHAVAQQLGVDHRTVSAFRDRACERLGLPLLHAVMAWRDYRGLKPAVRPAQPAIPYDLTPDQRTVWEMSMQGLRIKQIAEAMGVNYDRASNLINAARIKIPGEREGQKQAAWRRACSPGD